MKIANLLHVIPNFEKICILASTDAAYNRYGEKVNDRRVIFDGYSIHLINKKEYEDIRQDLYKEPVVSLKAENDTVVIGI